ncbi:MAG TPA: G1 family glutamic endopeptidase, partial [Acidimicrobiales bacterium]|nr:G1 family glutamic endopeptidase [Acidimicrobiales bacterium]
MSFVRKAAHRLVVAGLVTGGVLLGGTAAAAGAQGAPVPSHRQAAPGNTPTDRLLESRGTTIGLRPGYDRRPTGSGPSPRISGSGQQATTDQSSTNWAGLAESGGGTYTAVSASWIVPTVPSSGSLKVSSTWIGIDGFNNQNLIQTGTEQDSFGGHTDYYAWWEILPASEQPISTITVSAG